MAEQYVALLAGDGVVRGLIGPREAPRLWDRHVLNSAVLTELIPQDASVCDIGSGAGLPGVVLAIARPDLRLTLVEPLLRRTSFLEEAVAALGLGNVEVVRARAEALHGERMFDVVTSRAVAPLPRLLDWSLPLVAPAGALLALKGASVAEEVSGAAGELQEWGAAPARVVELGAAVLERPTFAVLVTWADPARVATTRIGPRSPGEPDARPGSRRGGKDARSARRAGSRNRGKR